MSNETHVRNFNKLAVRKELGAILYRLKDESLGAGIKSALIERNLENLLDELDETKLAGIVVKTATANRQGDFEEVEQGVLLLISLIPVTYGSIPAGTVFRLPGGAELLTKRKGGVERFIDKPTEYHLAADAVVVVINL